MVSQCLRLIHIRCLPFSCIVLSKCSGLVGQFLYIELLITNINNCIFPANCILSGNKDVHNLRNNNTMFSSIVRCFRSDQVDRFLLKREGKKSTCTIILQVERVGAGIPKSRLQVLPLGCIKRKDLKTPI